MQLAETLQILSDEFDERCHQRHERGSEKYGPASFLSVDTLEMAIEEVLDLANYARYTFIKMRVLQEELRTDTALVADKPKDGFHSSQTSQGIAEEGFFSFNRRDA